MGLQSEGATGERAWGCGVGCLCLRVRGMFAADDVGSSSLCMYDKTCSAPMGSPTVNAQPRFAWGHDSFRLLSTYYPYMFCICGVHTLAL